MKSFALSLAFMMMFTATRKWPSEGLRAQSTNSPLQQLSGRLVRVRAHGGHGGHGGAKQWNDFPLGLSFFYAYICHCHQHGRREYAFVTDIIIILYLPFIFPSRMLQFDQ